ncbi:MAG: helix-turn-helix domain-containing protein [Acidobacteria bacterium]|nr:helix-turn-helix domain-containing protein [Acidobacteriota bacterium]
MGKVEGILTELRERNQPAVGGFHLRRPDDFSLKKFAKTAAMEAERFLMLEALKETRWNRHRASKLLGVSYRALLYKMRDAGLPSKKRPKVAIEPVPAPESHAPQAE